MSKINSIVLDGVAYSVTDGTLTPIVAPPPPPPPPPSDWVWAGTWAEMDGRQEVRGTTSVLATHQGRADVLRCECQQATASVTPTKANREKHGFTAKEGDTLIVGMTLWVNAMPNLSAFRTWIDTESLSAQSNEGSRLSDKTGHLAFNEKFADGANRVDYGKPVLPVGRWVAVEFEQRLSRTASGLVLIRQDGQEVLRYAGVTMGPDIDRVQFGIASDDRQAGLVAFYASPWIRLKKAA